MNKTILMGRLTKDPVITIGDTKVARYSLAVDRPVSGERKADFISCVCFGKTADFAETYLKQGTKILVEGRIQTGSYEKNGQKIYTTDVIVMSHEFCESKGSDNKVTEDTHGFVNLPDSMKDEGLPF